MNKTWRRVAILGAVLATGGTGAAASPQAAAPRLLDLAPPLAAHTATSKAAVSADAATNVTYHGGPVMHASQVYSIYWVPSGYAVSANYQSVIDGFFRDVGAASGTSSNVYANDTQYFDLSGPIAYNAGLAGSVVDTAPFPTNGCTDPQGRPVCLTTSQLATEIASVMARQGWTAGPTKEFFIFTPNNVGSCFNSTNNTCAYRDFGGYHSWTSGGTAATLYAYISYPVSGDPNTVLSVTSHEQNETITDPQGNGWFDGSGDSDGEIGDKCELFGTTLGFSNGHAYNQVINGGLYELQLEWSNATSSCVGQFSGGQTVPDVQAAGTRFAMRTVNHELWIKDGLTGTWVDEAGGVDQFVLTPTSIVIRQGTLMWAKSGLNDGWTLLATSATDIQAAGTRFALLDGNHDLWVKDGLTGIWWHEAGAVDQYVLTPTFIMIRQGSRVWAKAGLNDNWTLLADGATDIQAAGTRFAILDGTRTLWVKDGLNGIWLNEALNVDQYVLTSTALVARQGSSMSAKAGLTDPWTLLAGGALDIQAAGTRFAEVDSHDTLWVKDGLKGIWWAEAANVDHYVLTPTFTVVRQGTLVWAKSGLTDNWTLLAA
jgi:hypothetical protein